MPLFETILELTQTQYDASKTNIRPHHLTNPIPKRPPKRSNPTPEIDPTFDLAFDPTLGPTFDPSTDLSYEIYPRQTENHGLYNHK